MTSPKKNVDMQRENTMFGQLNHIEKQTNFLNKQLLDEFQLINKLRGDLNGLQKEARTTSSDTRLKLTDQVKQFQQRIKNYLVAQKAQYMRFSNQINTMIQNSKQINSQLTLLGNKFDQFQKNVGI